MEIREVRKTKVKKKQIRACDREVSSVLIWIIGSSKRWLLPFLRLNLPRGRNSSSRTFATSSNHQQPVMVIYLLPVTRKNTKNNVRFETEAWNNWEITHCSDTFYLRASCPGSSLCLVIERSWEWGCLLTRRFRRRHSCDMCCSHISDVTYWQWHLNHIWHYTFKHTPHKLKKESYIFKNHHHHNIMSGLLW